MAMAIPSLAETKTYQLCTDLSEILNPDNQFILVGSKPITNGVSAVLITPEEKKEAKTIINNVSEVPTEISVDAEQLGLGLFSIKDNGDKKVLYENVSKKYWGGPNSNAVSTSETLGTSNDYKLTITLESNSWVKIVSASNTTTRYFQFNTNYFRNYADNNNYAKPLFYKEVTNAEPVDPNYTGFDKKYSMKIGEVMQFPEISPKELTYTFTTENSDIIEIDSDNNTFTALKDGTATISFSTYALDNRFNAGSGEFMIEVKKKTPKMSFSDPIVYGKLNVGVVWQEVVIEDPIDADRSTITYSSSDSDIVELDPATGQIKPENIKQTGEVTITAKLPGFGEYDEGAASYKILVIDPNNQVEPTSSIFDFTVENPYGMTTQTGSSSTYESLSEIDADNVVTLSFEGDYRSWQASSGYELRVMKGASFKVEVPEGYKITQIGVAGKNLTGSFNPASSSDDAGSHPEDWDIVSNHWHAGNQVVTSVTYTNPSKANTRDDISKIYVMYDSDGSTLKSARLSFSPTVNGIIAGEEATINAVNNPYGREVKYTLAGVENTAEEALYTITPSEDGKDLKVWVKNPGYYTLEARSGAGDGYRDGFAIMRLNVFNHLDVYANDALIQEEVIATENDVTVKFDVVQPQSLNIYYRIEDNNTPAVNPDEISDDENCDPGFILYEDQIDIVANTNGNLIFYVANYGYKSPQRTIVLGKGLAVAPEVPVLKGIENLENMGEDEGVTALMGNEAVTLSFDKVEGIEIYYGIMDYSLMKMSGEDNAPSTHAEGDDDEPWLLYSEPINLDKSGNYMLVYKAVDTVTGLESDQKVYMIILDIHNPLTAPQLLGLEDLERVEMNDLTGEENNIYFYDEDAETYYVISSSPLEVKFDFDVNENPDVKVMYSLLSEGGVSPMSEDDDMPFVEYDGSSIEIAGSCMLAYMAVNTATGEQSDVVQYMFMIETPFTVPAIKGFEDANMEGDDENGYMVESNSPLSLTFDIDLEEHPELAINYMITYDDEEEVSGQYDGTPIIIDRDCEFLVSVMDYSTFKRAMAQYMIFINTPVAPAAPTMKVEGNYTNDNGNLNAEEELTITLEAEEGMDIYYLLENRDVTPLKAKGCDSDHAGYTKHNGETININGAHKTFSFFACDPATGAHSEPVTYKLAVATGISGIYADDTDTMYFNLNGVRIEKPENGTYIRVSKGKAEKVVK